LLNVKILYGATKMFIERKNIPTSTKKVKHLLSMIFLKMILIEPSKCSWKKPAMSGSCRRP
ncbi:hypothetical protein L9F63_001846, partial [Diploptera punctata]